MKVYARRLFDGFEVRDDVLVDVADGVITAVQGRPAAVPEDTVRVEFLLPGLIDSHGHLAGFRDGGPREALPAAARNHLRLSLQAGVTTMRELGNYLEPIDLARGWSAGQDGPRIYRAGPLLDGPKPLWSNSRAVADADDAKRHVSVLAVEGVDLIKTYGRLGPDVLPAVVDAAREHGLPVAAHCGRTTARQAARAGVSSIEHLSHVIDEDLLGGPADGLTDPHTSRPERLVRAWSRVDPDGPAADRLLADLIEHRTVLCPTLLVTRRSVLFHEQLADRHLELGTLVMPHHRHLIRMRNPLGLWFGRKFLPPDFPDPDLRGDAKREVEGGLAAMTGLLARAFAAGVVVVAGTDAPSSSVIPGHSLHQEIAALVEAGLPATAALSAATGNAGRLIGDGRLGVIAPGAFADLVAVSGDPSRDITDLSKITAVMCRGTWVDRDALRKRLNADLENVLAHDPSEK